MRAPVNWRSLLWASRMMLTLSVAATGITFCLNVKFGWELSPEAAAIMGLATLGALITSSFARLNGWGWIERGTVIVCVVLSIWTELHYHAVSQASLSRNWEAKERGRAGAQMDLDAARIRLSAIAETSTVAAIDDILAENNKDVKAAERTQQEQEEAATKAGIGCVRRACLAALDAVRKLRETRKALLERRGQAEEKARLLGVLEASGGAAIASVTASDAFDDQVAFATGWPKEIVQRVGQAVFVGLLVTLNSLLALAGGRAVEGAARAQAMRRGEWVEPQPAVDRAVVPLASPSDAELLRLANEGKTLSELAYQFNGVPNCSRSSIGRRLQLLRGDV